MRPLIAEHWHVLCLNVVDREVIAFENSLQDEPCVVSVCQHCNLALFYVLYYNDINSVREESLSLLGHLKFDFMDLNIVSGKSEGSNVDEVKEMDFGVRNVDSESMQKVYEGGSKVKGDTVVTVDKDPNDLFAAKYEDFNPLVPASVEEEHLSVEVAESSKTRRRKRSRSPVIREDAFVGNASPQGSGSEVDSESSAEGSRYRGMERIYHKYCEEADGDEKIKSIKLTWDEYFS